MLRQQAGDAAAAVYTELRKDALEVRAYGRDFDAKRHPSAALLHLDSGVLDHLAPALFLAEKVAVEFFRRASGHHEAFVDTEPPERIRLHGLRHGFVETLDKLRRRFGRREQAIPGFRG